MRNHLHLRLKNSLGGITFIQSQMRWIDIPYSSPDECHLTWFPTRCSITARDRNWWGSISVNVQENKACPGWRNTSSKYKIQWDN